MPRTNDDIETSDDDWIEEDTEDEEESDGNASDAEKNLVVSKPLTPQPSPRKKTKKKLGESAALSGTKAVSAKKSAPKTQRLLIAKESARKGAAKETTTPLKTQYVVEQKAGAPPIPLATSFSMEKVPPRPATAAEVKRLIARAIKECDAQQFEAGLGSISTAINGVFVVLNGKKPRAPTVTWYTQERVEDNVVTLSCFNWVPPMRQLLTTAAKCLAKDLGNSFETSALAVNWDNRTKPDNANEEFTDLERHLVTSTTYLYPSSIKAFVIKAVPKSAGAEKEEAENNNSKQAEPTGGKKRKLPVEALELTESKAQRCLPDVVQPLPQKPIAEVKAISQGQPAAAVVQPSSNTSGALFRAAADLCSTYNATVTMNFAFEPQ